MRNRRFPDDAKVGFNENDVLARFEDSPRDRSMRYTSKEDREELFVIACFGISMRDVERSFHNMLEDCRVLELGGCREWFKVTNDRLAEILLDNVGAKDSFLKSTKYTRDLRKKSIKVDELLERPLDRLEIREKVRSYFQIEGAEVAELPECLADFGQFLGSEIERNYLIVKSRIWVPVRWKWPQFWGAKEVVIPYYDPEVPIELSESVSKFQVDDDVCDPEFRMENGRIKWSGSDNCVNVDMVEWVRKVTDIEDEPIYWEDEYLVDGNIYRIDYSHLVDVDERFAMERTCGAKIFLRTNGCRQVNYHPGNWC